MERGGSRQLLRLRPGWRGAAGGSGAGRRRCIPRAGRGRFTPSVIVGWLRRGAPGRGSGAAGAGGWSPVGRSIVGVFCTKDCNQWGLWGRACVGLSAGWAVGLGLRPSPAAGPRVALCGPPGRREGSEVALRLWSRVERAVGEGVRGGAGMEGRAPRCDTPRALHWLQFTLIHLMFKCKTSYATVLGWVFLLF